MPVRQHPLHRGAVGGLAGLQLLGPQGQVGAQPVAGLLPQAGSPRVVELGRIVALSGGGQRCVASGVVAVSGFQVVGQLGVGGEGGGVQVDRHQGELLDLAPLGQCQAFRVAGGRVAAVLVGGELIPDRGHPLRLREQGSGKGGELRVEFDGRLEAGDGLVQLALLSQRIAQVVVGPGVLRVEFDGLAVAGDGLVHLALLSFSALPRLVWAAASFGSSSMALRKQAMASSHWPLAYSALPRL